MMMQPEDDHYHLLSMSNDMATPPTLIRGAHASPCEHHGHLLAVGGRITRHCTVVGKSFFFLFQE